jgi:hypothetical protein
VRAGGEQVRGRDDTCVDATGAPTTPASALIARTTARRYNQSKKIDTSAVKIAAKMMIAGSVPVNATVTFIKLLLSSRRVRFDYRAPLVPQVDDFDFFSHGQYSCLNPQT